MVDVGLWRFSSHYAALRLPSSGGKAPLGSGVSGTLYICRHTPSVPLRVHYATLVPLEAGTVRFDYLCMNKLHLFI